MSDDVGIDLDRLAKVYVKIRDARSERKREWEAQDKEFEQKLHTLGATMLDTLNRTQQESARTAHGTIYRQIEIKPNVGDWDALYAWIRNHDAFDALEKRVKKTFVTEYMEMHDGDLPPGVSVLREFVIRVRRGNE